MECSLSFCLKQYHMAIPVARLIRDQNIDVPYSGGASLGGKAEVAKSQKKGGLGGTRKALNDISNSGRPSALQASKKHYSNNVISSENDVGGKSNILIDPPPQKGKNGKRKALSDVTNAEKPSRQQVTKKLSVISEECLHIDPKEEGFLHNHRECIKAQRKAMDNESFLKLVGLDDDGSPFAMRPPLSKLRPESPRKHLQMEEMLIEEDRVFKCARNEFSGYYSPACGSPTSPKSPYATWNEDNLQDFALIDTPRC